MGAHHGLVLYEDGSVDALYTGNASYSWKWQTGTGKAEPQRFALLPTGLSDIVSISCGTYFSVALDKFGTAHASGCNQHGAFGNGKDARSERSNTVGEEYFTSILSGVTSLTAGSSFIFVVKSDSTLWVAGANPCGATGVKHTYQISGPAPMSFFQPTGIEDVAEVHASHRLSMVKTRSGEWFYTGDARTNPGSVRGTPLAPTDTWSPLEGLNPQKLKLSGDTDGMLIEQDSSVLAKGHGPESFRLNTYFTSPLHFGKTGLSGEDVALTYMGAFVRISGEWYSSYAKNHHGALSVRDPRTHDTKYNRMAHPAVWQTALQMSSLGMAWEDTVLLAEATS